MINEEKAAEEKKAQAIAESINKAKNEAEEAAREAHSAAMDELVTAQKMAKAKQVSQDGNRILDRAAELQLSQDQRIANREAGQRQERAENRAISQEITKQDAAARRNGLGYSEEQKASMRAGFRKSVDTVKSAEAMAKDIAEIKSTFNKLEQKLTRR